MMVMTTMWSWERQGASSVCAWKWPSTTAKQLPSVRPLPLHQIPCQAWQPGIVAVDKQKHSNATTLALFCSICQHSFMHCHMSACHAGIACI